jgi:N-acetylmuramoyl-L-alanine amidase
MPEVKEVKEPIAVKAEENPTINSKEGLYKIQLFATSRKRDVSSADFKGLKDISFTLENNLYKYFYGSAVSLEVAKKLNEEAKKQGFPDSFIVTTVGGKTASIK